MPNHTYNIFVTPGGGSEQLIGANFAFRTEQSGATSLSNWALYAASGSHQMCNITISPAPNFSSLGGGWIGSLSSGGSFSFSWRAAILLKDGYVRSGNPSCPGTFAYFGPATIIGSTFTDYWQGSSYSITVIGTFQSSTYATGRFIVTDNTPGSPYWRRSLLEHYTMNHHRRRQQ